MIFSATVTVELMLIWRLDMIDLTEPIGYLKSRCVAWYNIVSADLAVG